MPAPPDKGTPQHTLERNSWPSLDRLSTHARPSPSSIHASRSTTWGFPHIPRAQAWQIFRYQSASTSMVGCDNDPPCFIYRFNGAQTSPTGAGRRATAESSSFTARHKTSHHAYHGSWAITTETLSPTINQSTPSIETQPRISYIIYNIGFQG